MHTYDYWGLRLAANEAWPALEPFRTSTAARPDVTIETRPQPFDHTATHVNVEPDWVQFQVANVGRYTICAGQAIEVVPAPHCPPHTLELFLLGSAWGALCYQRGLLPLHASVVQWADRALAFCGPSGAGKSTLVARLVEHGGRLLSDDLCRCDPDADPAPVVWPSLPRFKLWQATLAALGRSSDGLVQDLPTEAKYHWPAGGAAAGGPVPLRAVYLLEWGALGAERLSGTQALRQFMPAATYRAELLEGMGRLSAYWQACAQLLRRVPVYRLSRPKDWSSLDAVEALLRLP